MLLPMHNTVVEIMFDHSNEKTQIFEAYDYVFVDGYIPPDTSKYDLYIKYNQVMNIARGVVL